MFIYLLCAPLKLWEREKIWLFVHKSQKTRQATATVNTRWERWCVFLNIFWYQSINNALAENHFFVVVFCIISRMPSFALSLSWLAVLFYPQTLLNKNRKPSMESMHKNAAHRKPEPMNYDMTFGRISAVSAIQWIHTHTKRAQIEPKTTRTSLIDGEMRVSQILQTAFKLYMFAMQFADAVCCSSMMCNIYIKRACFKSTFVVHSHFAEQAKYINQSTKILWIWYISQRNF